MQSNIFNLKIIFAEDGSIFKMQVNSSTSIDTIKNALAGISKLPPSEQILLTDQALKSKTLEYYGITSDRDIYLFNRKILEDINLQPIPCILSNDQFQRLPIKRPPQDLSHYEKSNNSLYKLFALEFHLQNQVMAIRFIRDELSQILAASKNYPNNIIHQKNAIKVANASFFEYRENSSKYLTEFFKDFRKRKPYLESILSSFESDISKLKQIKLHESLRTNNKVTLGDCIPENDFRKWNKQCREEYENLKSKIDDIENRFNSVYSNSEELNKTISINEQEVINKYKELESSFLKVNNNHYQTFSSNYEKLQNALQQFRITPNEKNKVDSDLQNYLDIKKNQDDIIQNIRYVFDPVPYIVKKKNEMNNLVFSQLRTIAKYQGSLKEVKSLISVYTEALSKFLENFKQLEFIHNLPQSYEDSINEIGRRKKFGNNINSSFNKFLESLKMIRDDENQKRQVFLEQYYFYLQHVPINSFNSLKEFVPDVSIQLPPFDQNLPNINNISSSGLNVGGFGSGSNSNSNSGSGSSNGSSTNNDFDGFTVIDNLAENINNNLNNKPNNNNNNTNSNISSNNINNNNIPNSLNSSSINYNNKKLLNDLEKSQIEKQQLEQKLQTTFLIASKTEEKYKDLLEKSKHFNQSYLEKQHGELIKIEELKKELSEKKIQIDILTDQLTNFSNERLSNQTAIFSLEGEKVQLESQVTDFKSKVEDYEQKLVDLQKEFEQKELNSKSQYESEIESKVREIEIKKSEVQELESSIGQLKENIINLQVENETIKKEKELLELELHESKLKSDQLVKELNIITSKKESLEIELISLQEKNKEIENFNSSLKDNADGSQKVFEELLDTNKQLDKTINQLKLTNQQNEISIAQLESSNKVLEDSNKDLNKTIDQLKSINQQHEICIAELEASKKEFEESQKKLQQINKQLEENSQKLQSNINEYESSAGDLYTIIEKYKLEIQTLEVTKESLVEHQSQLEEKNKSLNSNVVNLEKDIQELQLSIKTKDSILLEQIEMNNKSSSSIQELESKLSQLGVEKSNVEIELEKANAMLLKSKSENDASITQIKSSYEAQLKKLQLEIGELKENQVEIMAQLKKKDEEVIKIMTELESKESLNNTEVGGIHKFYEEELNKAFSEHDRLQKEISQLSDRNAEYINENELLKEVKAQNETTHRQEIDDYKSREIALESKLQEQNQQIKQLLDKSNPSDNDKIILDKEERIKDLTTRLSDVSSRFSDLQIRYNSTSNNQQELNRYKNVIFELSRLIEPERREPLALEKISEEVSKAIHDLKIERSQSVQLSNFIHDRLVIFYPNKNKIYEAINIGQPHRFLSQDCYPQFGPEMKAGLPIIGTIISIEPKIAPNPNDLHIHAGTEFFECYITKYTGDN